MDVIVTKPRSYNGWVHGVANDRWFCAKVYDEPSAYGVNNCRVSKLSIAKEGVHLLGLESGLPFFDNVDFNYDRGLDFHNDELSKEDLDALLEWLNALPDFHN